MVPGNYTFINRVNKKKQDVDFINLEIASCKMSVLKKEKIIDGRLWHTTDTNDFFYDWGGKRIKLNVTGDGENIITEIDKLSNDISKLNTKLSKKMNEISSSLDEIDEKVDTFENRIVSVEGTVTTITDVVGSLDDVPTEALSSNEVLNVFGENN